MKTLRRCLGIIIGLVLLIIGILLFIKENHVDDYTKRTKGIVVEIVETGSNVIDDAAWRRNYYPVVEYKVKKKTYRAQSKVSVEKDTYKVDDQVKVFYNPKNVEDISLKRDTSYLLPSIFCGIGVLVVILGVMYYTTGKFLPFGIEQKIRKYFIKK